MNHQQKQSGQTLVEVMVALFILTIGMLGILELLYQSIYISKNITTQTTATELASEGVELAENIAEHDVYQHFAGTGTGWGTAFGNGGYFELDYTTCNDIAVGTSCDHDPNSNFPKPPQSQCQSDLLSYVPALNTYLYPGDAGVNATTPTIFSRCIQVTPNPANANEITVDSTVYWTSGTQTQNVEVEDDLYNWQPST